jgi:hypothetical protein
MATLTFKTGKTTCLIPNGGWCRWVGAKSYGTVYCCRLFSANLYDENGGVTGDLQRLPECLALDESIEDKG